jgi:hypothetical protein
MGSILLAVAWAGAGSGTMTTSVALSDLAIALALTGVVAWLAHGNERGQTRRREEELAAAIPVAGVH